MSFQAKSLGSRPRSSNRGGVATTGGGDDGDGGGNSVRPARERSKRKKSKGG